MLAEHLLFDDGPESDDQGIKDKQYIEPGKVVDFKDETRFDQTSDGWKGQDGKIY